MVKRIFTAIGRFFDALVDWAVPDASLRMEGPVVDITHRIHLLDEMHCPFYEALTRLKE